MPIFVRSRPPALPGEEVVIRLRLNRDSKRLVLDEAQRELLAAALAICGGNVTRAAEALGIYRQSLQRMLVRHGLRVASAPAAPADAERAPDRR